MSPKPKILIVDDEPVSLIVLEAYLKEAGYDPIVASSGQAAWDLLTNSANNFALVITDRMMPNMDGIELTRLIRAQLAFTEIPVIMLTSAAEKVDKIAAVRSGVFDFLMKPIEKELLILVIQRALRTTSSLNLYSL